MSEAAPPSGPRLWLGALPPSGDGHAPVHIAPGLGVAWVGETLRAVVPGAGSATPSLPRSRRHQEAPPRRRSRGLRRRSGPTGPLGAAEAERLAADAVERDDAGALAALESRLTSAHRAVFPRAQRPVLATSPALTLEDAKQAREAAVIAAAGIQRRRERRSVKTAGSRAKLDPESAPVKAFLAAGRIAARVRDGYAQAAADSTWRGLEAHDATAVIAALEASFAESAGDCTCIDAGRAGADRRAYVTVVLRAPGPEVVPDRGPGVSATGRPMLRRRTAAQREETYRSILASATLATVNHVLGAAVATDDVNVVLIRPALPSATDLQSGGGRQPRFEGLHVARLSREEVTLRPVDADPAALVFGTAEPPRLLDHDEVTGEGDSTDQLSTLVEALNASHGDD